MLLSYCIAKENSDTSEKVSYHIHCWLNFLEDINCVEIRELLEIYFPDCNYDIQPCRSSRNTLKYISKEDKHLLTNVSTSKLSFNYQLFIWAEKTETFSFTDPFVVNNHQKYLFLQKYHAEFRSKIPVEFELKPFEVTYSGWAMDVILWFNEAINNTKHKFPMLYLYGDTNVGKTSLIELLIGDKNMKYVFYPDIGKFAFQDLYPNFHKIILFEEFDCKYHCTGNLKRLLERKPFKASVKCSVGRIIDFKGLIIFVSNFDSFEDEALRSRVKYVHASSPFWLEEKVLLPKTEVQVSDQEEIEIVEISSSPLEAACL